MSKVCLCLTAKTIAKDLELLEEHRQSIDIAELRADCLSEDECSHIRKFPRLAGLPVILTVRRKIDGGLFRSGESYRAVLLSKALAFAEPDKRNNFAYVDIEEDLDVPGIEEAARAYGTRIIRSFHSFSGGFPGLKEKINLLYRVGDEIAKAAVMPRDLTDVKMFIRSAKELDGRDKIVLVMGELGYCTRILAAKTGSYLTYAYSAGAHTEPPAPGMCEIDELVNTYGFRNINRDTVVYGITGYPIKTTGSPAFHNKAFREKRMNAVYVRFPAPTIESFLSLADELELRGASVTVPHKEAVLKYLRKMSREVDAIGACNTIVRIPKEEGGGWAGFNTDVYGFSDSLAALLEKGNIKKKDIKKKKFTIIGAGGAARAVAAAVSAFRAKALILNRSLGKAQAIAEMYKFRYGAPDDCGISLMRKYNDVIVQTTSLGSESDVSKDPASLYHFDGSEIVIDIIYRPPRTKFLQRALTAGCLAINGEDMLRRQAEYQFREFCKD